MLLPELTSAAAVGELGFIVAVENNVHDDDSRPPSPPPTSSLPFAKGRSRPSHSFRRFVTESGETLRSAILLGLLRWCFEGFNSMQGACVGGR